MIAKRTYALEIATLIQAQKDKLDATFHKGLKQIMGMKTTYAQIIAGEAPTNTNKSLLGEANKELTKLTEEVEEEQEEPTTGQTRTSKTRTRKEKVELKKRIHLENKLNEQAIGTFSYMVWEGKKNSTNTHV